MPTYNVSIKQGLLNEEQKNRLAQFITQAHTEATGAPNYFVQVIIDENQNGVRYLGGHPSEKHIWINGDIRGGRTVQQRQQLMLNIMQGVSKITGVEESLVWVYLNNLEPDDMVEYGRVLPLPGKESEWFSYLPKEIQAYLNTLGVDSKNFML